MDVIDLLEAVVSTMDTIPVVGIDNQDKFVGCANAVRTAVRKLRAAQAEKAAPAKTEVVKEEPNG